MAQGGETRRADTPESVDDESEEGDVSGREWGILILSLCFVVAVAKAWWSLYDWIGSLDGKRGQIQFLLGSGAVAVAIFLMRWGDK